MFNRFVLVALLAFTWPAAAGINRFTTVGPSGAIAYDVEFADGGTLLASTARGVYRSTDDGASWTQTLTTPAWFPMRLAVNPANRTIALIGTTILKRSTDGGQTWSDVANLPGLQNNPAGFIAFSADGTMAWLSQQNGGNLYRSTDGGVTWTLNTTTGVADAIIWIEADATDAQLVYVTTPNGAYRSTNGGTTFARLPHSAFSAVIAASHSRANLAIATDANDVPWRSTDGGVTWSPLAASPIRFLQFCAGNSDSALAMRSDEHLLRTPDSGATWSDLGPLPNGRIWGMASDPANPSHVVIAGNGGIFVSTNGGTSWNERVAGLRDPDVRQAVVGRSPGAGTLYLLTTDLASIHRRDSMGNWEARAATATPLLGYPASGASLSGYYALGVAPQDANLLYMARDARFGVSTDGGATWVARPSTPIYAESVAIAPNDAQTVYIGSHTSAAFRSVNGGASWSDLTAAGLPTKMRWFTFDPTNPAIVYAAVDNYLAPAVSPVFKSVNGGVSFTATAWNTADNAGPIQGLVHDPVRANIVYLASFGGAFRSKDGGATWQRSSVFVSGQNISGVQQLVVDGDSPDIVYATSMLYGHIARSVNGGVDWDIVPHDDELSAFTSLALVPGARSKVLAGRSTGAVEFEFSPDVSIETSAPSATSGTSSVTTLTVKNASGFAASDVRVTATLPASSGTPSAQPSSGQCTITGQDLVCRLGIVRGLASATVALTYTPTAAGTWGASVSAYEPDEASANNTVQVNVVAPPPAPSPGGGAGGGGGGGGRLDYLLLVALLGTLCGRRFVRSC